MAEPSAPQTPARPDLPDHIEQAIQAIADLHAHHHRTTTASQKALGRIVETVARPRFLGFMTMAVVAWVGFNLALQASGRHAPDPAPFFWLDTVAAVSALYVTVIILTSQRRDDQLSELREQLTLELAILAEQKSAKAIELLEALRRDTPSVPDRHDEEAEAMARPADTQSVLEALQDSQAEAGLIEPDQVMRSRGEPPER